METHFDQELRSLKERLLHMGGLAEKMLQITLDALTKRDSDLAKNVFDIEREVNGLHIEVDDRCIKLLALRQPMAIDLRLIAAVMKINSDLERIADQAVNVCQTAYYHLFKEPPVAQADLIPRMGQIALSMLQDSLEAFSKKDVALARTVLAQEKEEDRLKAENLNYLIALLKEAPAHSKQFVDIILIAKNLERIGDHATNIAEDVIFMVQAKDIRHHQGETSSLA